MKKGQISQFQQVVPKSNEICVTDISPLLLITHLFHQLEGLKFNFEPQIRYNILDNLRMKIGMLPQDR